MVIDLINYSLSQNHQSYSLEKSEPHLLKLSINNKNYIIYYNDIAHSGSGRNFDEIRIQLSVIIKHKLIGYLAEDYTILLLGFDKSSNTFTVWKYDNNFETNTKQSLYSRRSIINLAKKKGFSNYYFKKREAFNNRGSDQRSVSVSFNAFLFPLIIKNYSKIFEKDFLNDFDRKIKRYNLPYSKDDLMLSLNLYALDRKTKNIDKKDPHLEEVSKLCNLRFKLLGFTPLSEFVPNEYVKKFRNINGIYTKIQNFKHTDPNEEGGYPGGAHEPQKKIWNLYFENGNINKLKLQNDTNDLIKKILSNDVETLIGNKKISVSNHAKIQTDDVFTNHYIKPEILDLELDQKYINRIINPDNFSDKIETLNQLDKSNELHEKTINNLAKLFKKKGLPVKRTIHIDFFSVKNNKGYLFEVKTFTKSNFNQQIRHGIIQLKEYYFVYSEYWKIIPKETNLYLMVDKNPTKLIKDIQKKFLNSQKISLCWIEDNRVVSIDNKNLF